MSNQGQGILQDRFLSNENRTLGIAPTEWMWKQPGYICCNQQASTLYLLVNSFCPICFLLKSSLLLKSRWEKRTRVRSSFHKYTHCTLCEFSKSPLSLLKSHITGEISRFYTFRHPHHLGQHQTHHFRQHPEITHSSHFGRSLWATRISSLWATRKTSFLSSLLGSAI